MEAYLGELCHFKKELRMTIVKRLTDIENASLLDLKETKEDALRTVRALDVILTNPITSNHHEITDTRHAKAKRMYFLGQLNARIKTLHREQALNPNSPFAGIKKEMKRAEHRRLMALAAKTHKVDPEDPYSLLHGLWKLLCELKTTGRVEFTESERFLTFQASDLLEKEATLCKDGLVRRK